MNVERMDMAVGSLPATPMPTSASERKIKARNTLFKILATAAVAGLLLGVLDVGNDAFSGLCRAFGAVFFILAFITKAIDKAEHTLS
jgi:hypothetical protein